MGGVVACKMSTKGMNNDPYHYQIIARAIAHIDNTRAQQPSLDDIARAIGLSPSYFQRIFTKWAGISPKRYQQFATLKDAKLLLQDGHSLLSASDDLGLSSASRLHDLFITWEAMSPGEYAKRGAGLNIAYGFADSPFGQVVVTMTQRGLCGLGFCDAMGADAALADLTGRWPNAHFYHDSERATEMLDAIVTQHPVHLQLIGTGLQLKVWEALLTIPSGAVASYSAIAAQAGNPRAVRAVGTAIGRNPISWLVPCHRALRKSGGLGGYHWGLSIKKSLLLRESVASPHNPLDR